MNKTFLSIILAAAGWAAFHFGLKPIFTPEDFSLIFNRYVYFILLALYLVAYNLILRLQPSMAVRALYVWLMGFYFYNPYQEVTILYPPIPWTLFITYMMLWTIGTFLFISQDPKTFADFREPIVKTVIGEYKIARYIVFAALPVFVGFATYKAIYPTYPEPVELRTVHPAPRQQRGSMVKPIRWRVLSILSGLMSRTTILTASRFSMRISRNI